MADTTIIQRLGLILYWTGCGVSGLLILGCLVGIAMVLQNDRNPTEGIGIVTASTLIPAVFAWLIGRACKYILASR